MKTSKVALCRHASSLDTCPMMFIRFKSRCSCSESAYRIHHFTVLMASIVGTMTFPEIQHVGISGHMNISPIRLDLLHFSYGFETQAVTLDMITLVGPPIVPELQGRTKITRCWNPMYPAKWHRGARPQFVLVAFNLSLSTFRFKFGLFS